jgi:hypothetical protein
MSKRISIRATSRINNRRQAFALILFGVLFLVAAIILYLILHSKAFTFPLGVFFFGLGILIASYLNPRRLGIAGWLITTLGIATFLVFSNYIPGSQVLAFYLLAVGLGLLGIAFMARRGYIRAGAITPALIVIVVGIMEFLLAARLTPAGFVSFMLSLWLPGSGLLVLGIIYLVVTIRE